MITLKQAEQIYTWKMPVITVGGIVLLTKHWRGIGRSIKTDRDLPAFNRGNDVTASL